MRLLAFLSPKARRRDVRLALRWTSLLAVWATLACSFTGTAFAQDVSADASSDANSDVNSDSNSDASTDTAPVPPSTGATTNAANQEAREEFLEGGAAAEEGRWADSLEHFQNAYVLSGVPVALYNAAMALRALGRHVEARDAFQQILDSHPDSSAAEQSRPKRDEEAARVAVLTLAGLDPTGSYHFRIDGRTIPTQQGAEVRLEADAGQHGVAVDRDGYEDWAWEGELADGQQLRLTIEMVELPELESSSIFSSPVFWIITGVVLAGAGAGLGFWLQSEAQLDPTFANNAREI